MPNTVLEAEEIANKQTRNVCPQEENVLKPNIQYNGMERNSKAEKQQSRGRGSGSEGRCDSWGASLTKQYDN